MTVTEAPADTAEQTRIADEAVDALLAEHNPADESQIEFRGHQYDAGLAWVHHPAGFGGLGLSRRLQRAVDRRLRATGAQPADPSTFFMMLVGPTILTHGTDEQKRRYLRPMFTGRSGGASCSASPAPARTSRGLAPGPSATATSGWSTARRCGTRWPTSPTLECWWPAPTRSCPSTRG